MCQSFLYVIIPAYRFRLEKERLMIAKLAAIVCVSVIIVGIGILVSPAFKDDQREKNPLGDKLVNLAQYQCDSTYIFSGVAVTQDNQILNLRLYEPEISATPIFFCNDYIERVNVKLINIFTSPNGDHNVYFVSNPNAESKNRFQLWIQRSGYLMKLVASSNLAFHEVQVSDDADVSYTFGSPMVPTNESSVTLSNGLTLSLSPEKILVASMNGEIKFAINDVSYYKIFSE